MEPRPKTVEVNFLTASKPDDSKPRVRREVRTSYFFLVVFFVVFFLVAFFLAAMALVTSFLIRATVKVGNCAVNDFFARGRTFFQNEIVTAEARHSAEKVKTRMENGD